MASEIIRYGLYALGAILFLVVLFGSVFTIEQQTIGVVQRFGKFLKLANPGLNFKLPIIDQVVHEVSLRVEQLDVDVETKTQDDVTVHIKTSVQYKVLAADVHDAYYKLSDHKPQIEAYVYDAVRSKAPNMLLDQVFENKDVIADAVKSELTDAMKEFGYTIVKALVTDVDPDEKVKKAMNDINAAQRHQTAAKAKGEADKILVVKAAEAEAESKALQGKGIAEERKAIARGLVESADILKAAGGQVDGREAMQTLLLVQYLDTISDIGKSSGSRIVFMDPSPGGLHNFAQQIARANLASEPHVDQVSPKKDSHTNGRSSHPS